jgi:hypothetical protein
MNMQEAIGFTLAGLVVLGVLVLGYRAWREKRREEDASKGDGMWPDDPGQQAKGGGGPKPVK